MADSSEPTREEKIADELRAAPAYIADSATVIDWDMTIGLREGSPDWISVPTPPDKPNAAPMCGDPTFIQWFRDVTQGKPPTIDRIGIAYMLMGEVGTDFDHPEQKHPPEGKDWYHVGPHVMVVFLEGTGRMLQGLAHDTTLGLPYVRPFPGAEPLLVVPVALPGELIEAKPGSTAS